MKKYIIKNCPAYKGCCTNEFRQGLCSDISDCLLKRIVELCKITEYRVFNHKREVIGIKPSLLAGRILSLLEIEEAE